MNKKTDERIEKLEKELEEKNKQLLSLERLKSEFVSTVSHELRTPMVITRESVNQVHDGFLGDVNAEQKQFLSIAMEGIDRLGRIVDDLLDFSKLDAGKSELGREPANIVTVAKNVLNSYQKQAEEKGLALKFTSERYFVEANVDRDRMAHVFTNLIDNAMKFTSKGSIELKVVDRDGMVQCSVEDSGKGIPTDELDRVFGHFEQVGRKNGPGDRGTGLGLAICKKIIELHNGRLWVESRLEVGTKFLFEIPKVSADNLLREYVEMGVRDAIRSETAFSMIVLPMGNFDTVKKKMGNAEATTLLHDLAKMLRASLRRRRDRAMATHENLIVFLPETSKEEALRMSGRLQQLVEDHLNKIGFQKVVKIVPSVASLPDDGNTDKEILKKAFG